LDGGRLDDGAEGLIVIHPGALSEPLEYPTSLVSVKRAICLELMFENPLAGDDISPRRPRNQVPRVVGQQGLVLLHNSTQWRSTSALRTKDGTGDRVGGAAAIEL
jgi:hypothetical protein